MYWDRGRLYLVLVSLRERGKEATGEGKGETGEGGKEKGGVDEGGGGRSELPADRGEEGVVDL